MKKNSLVTKWLDNNLKDGELAEFKKLDEHSSYLKISEAAKHFKAPQFDRDKNYLELTKKLAESKSKPKVIYTSWMLRIAAIFVIAFGLYFAVYNTSETTYYAAHGLRTEVELPDTSGVILNAGSSLSFEEKNWDSNRNISLQGEAFFKVAKGKTFTVQIEQGTVKVLGTQFNVKSRPSFFEVICYEGLVQVSYNNKTYEVSAGNSFKAFDNQIFENQISDIHPSWIGNKSNFKSVPVFEVFKEIERQYNVSIDTKNIPKNTIFTGSFTHDNLETALKSVTTPLGLTYLVEDSIVTLKMMN